ncbi:DUF4350 domain-containing protein [Sulfuriroseicoccus oceanibius]|uniref:DUF4350 domain-containing protein n=1 Tax=Sulfuriroseicoccus oceanibius TaxID=2707525 RepID=A0A6B3L5V9_9BACT|nr:DUF4350 domain-containing protein [Sulfuriroseicoccus oceanibius]QQL45695.1 hypothetical protein G3M56_003645 [Sulfuriroseicoccus oceanibius]
MSVWRRCLAGFVVLAAFLFAGCRGDGQWEEEQLGYTGKARRYPFLAASRVLEEAGYGPTDRLRSVFVNDKHYGTMFVRASSVADKATVNRLRRLLRDDVHLVLLLDGGERYLNDFSKGHRALAGSWQAEDIRDTALIELLDEFGIELDDGIQFSAEAPVRYSLGGETFEVAADADFGVRCVRAEPVIESVEGDGDAALIVTRRALAGRLTVVANAMPFRSRFLAEGDHAHLLMALMDLSDYGGIAVVEDGGISFFGMVWRRGSLLVVAGGLALVLWLWRRMTRRAPVLAAPEVALTDFGERIEGLGHFVWSQKGGAQLLEGMKRELLARWGTATGQMLVFPEMPDSGSISERIRGEVSADDIRAALTLEAGAESEPMLLAISNLQKVIRLL